MRSAAENWELALSEIERMAASDKVLSLELECSLRISLMHTHKTTTTTKSTKSSTNNSEAMPNVTPFLDLELQNIRAHLVQRLKYKQGHVTVGALHGFSTTNLGLQRVILTTAPELHYHQPQHRVAAHMPFIDCHFEQPPLTKSLRERLVVRLVGSSCSDDC